MARRRFKKGRRSAASRRPHIPMALALPLLADGFYLYGIAKNGVTDTEMVNLTYQYTGWNGTTMDSGQLIKTYGKYMVGGLVSMAATKLGVNRKIYKLTRGYVGI